MTFWLRATVALCIAWLTTGDSVQGQEAFFAERLQPFLQKYCIDCHSGEAPEADLAFDIIKDESAIAGNRERWSHVVEYLEAGIMPPDDQPQPTLDEVASINAWIGTRLANLGGSGVRDPGRVTIRRLNRIEYNNTVRDLVGVDFQPADDFPSDDVGYGFDNIGDVLSLPPILLEKYLAAADKIAARAIVDPWPPKPEIRKFAEGQLISGQRGRKGVASGRLEKEGDVYVEREFLAEADYIIRCRAHAEQAGDEPARMALRLDGKDLATFEVLAVAGSPGLYEARTHIATGKRRIAAAFLNNFVDPENPDETRRDRNLIVESLEIDGPHGEVLAPPSHRQLIVRTPAGDEEACAEEILTRFASRAYRRPVAAEEVDRLMELVRLARDSGDSFERAIRLAVQAALVSPHFLFRVELDADTSDEALVQQIDNHQLAARLSYFLWSSMPDEELFRLAEQGGLSNDEVLAAQVRRMIADPRSQQLVENFAGQWLQIRNLSIASPDRKRFKGFDEFLRTAMRKETELFFASVMREDRSIVDLLDADYTFLNERLAKHYGIEGIEGDEFRRVQLTDRRRGGVLTQASVLMVTSNPTRTSPVKRGKWIMEQILGTPPPPPPPGVQELEQVKLEGTLRQKMEQHRANASCAVCHARMDPLGFAFENFDAIGAWRDQDEDHPIDPSGVLPGGKTFSGATELRALLAARPELFARSLVRKMLTYALGRGLEAYDTQTVADIAERLKSQDYKFSALVLEIVRSQPFQMRRARGAE
ncbi:MAG TPA: DUF1592 domain-containing protein [Pirellulales bacterium]|nr:DUF1592 domain-containing protein [Pirellulales bacterium]